MQILLGISTDNYDALEAAATILSPVDVFENFNGIRQTETARPLASLPPPNAPVATSMKLLGGPSRPSEHEVALVKQSFLVASPLNQTLLAAARACNVANVKVLLKCGAAPDSRGFKRESCLHIAAWKNQPEIIGILADSGADINAADSQGQTPLHVAVQYRSVASAEKLLKLGAVLDLRDASWKTPPGFGC
jgi:ankyrin repeat protein